MSDPRARWGLGHAVAGAGPPLILLHGLSGSGRWWSRNIPVFAAHFQTYTVDLPGFGASRAIRWTRLDHIVDWLVGWMEDEGLAPAHVAGHSLGGAVAARLAVRYPRRVDRLVLVGAAIRARGVRAGARVGDVWRAVGRRPPGFTPMLVRDLLRTHPGSFVVATAEIMQSDWEERLAQIAAPTLVVWGERDPITPLSHGRRIAAAIPDARLVTFPNVGHNPMWECTEAFNEEVVRFLRGDAADGPLPLSPLSHRGGRGGL